MRFCLVTFVRLFDTVWFVLRSVQRCDMGVYMMYPHPYDNLPTIAVKSEYRDIRPRPRPTNCDFVDFLRMSWHRLHIMTHIPL